MSEQLRVVFVPETVISKENDVELFLAPLCKDSSRSILYGLSQSTGDFFEVIKTRQHRLGSWFVTVQEPQNQEKVQSNEAQQETISQIKKDIIIEDGSCLLFSPFDVTFLLISVFNEAKIASDNKFLTIDVLFEKIPIIFKNSDIFSKISNKKQSKSSKKQLELEKIVAMICEKKDFDDFGVFRLCDDKVLEILKKKVENMVSGFKNKGNQFYETLRKKMGDKSTKNEKESEISETPFFETSAEALKYKQEKEDKENEEKEKKKKNSEENDPEIGKSLLRYSIILLSEYLNDKWIDMLSKKFEISNEIHEYFEEHSSQHSSKKIEIEEKNEFDSSDDDDEDPEESQQKNLKRKLPDQEFFGSQSSQSAQSPLEEKEKVEDKPKKRKVNPSSKKLEKVDTRDMKKITEFFKKKTD